ncbi:hypothetical protein EV652_11828 [Kribbella steppae]|uniref:Uncharacterized protein n=1 Tax=Kribbella steppae TaxID=2512223 RepID=A0A4R2H226_9ACTN|nr:hypothetical protein EV652_11828 [Kribbella steppae]
MGGLRLHVSGYFACERDADATERQLGLQRSAAINGRESMRGLGRPARVTLASRMSHVALDIVGGIFSVGVRHA